MWGRYGDTGDGIAIGFDRDKLAANIEKSDGSQFLIDVDYAIETELKTKSFNIVGQLYCKWGPGQVN